MTLPSAELFLESNFETVGIPWPLRDELRKLTPRQVVIEATPGKAPELYIGGRRVYEGRDPLSTVREQVGNLIGKDDANAIVLFGLGLGYHAEEIERRFTRSVIVFEPSLDVLATTLSRRPLPLARTTVVSDSAQLLAQVQQRLQFTDRQFVVAAIPAYQQFFAEEFALFKSVIEQALVGSRILDNTVTIRARNWIEYAARNIPTAARLHSIDVLGKRFAQKPGILVSAGPSLDHNIGLLKQAEGKALILAVNAAVRPLDRARVRPDIVAVVEALDLRAQLREIDWLKDVVLAPTLSSFPGFFDLKARQIFPLADFSTACSEWLAKAYGWTRFGSGGSVACMGFSILYHLGCDPIILVGQDLAYTGGMSYAKETTYGGRRMRFDEGTGALEAVERNEELERIREASGLDPMLRMAAHEAPAWGGQGTVWTTEMFAMFRSWFEAAARSWAKDRRLINATEGGARISDFEELPFRDALQKWCTTPFPIREQIDEAVLSAKTPDESALRWVISNDLDALERIQVLTRQTVEIASRACEAIKSGKVAEAESRLKELSSLEAELREVSANEQLLNAYVAGEVNALRAKRFDDCREDKRLQTMKSLARSRELFLVIERGAAALIDIFTPVVEELHG